MRQILAERKNDSPYALKGYARTRHYPLENLFYFLSDKQMRWIQATEDEQDSRKIIVWSEWDIKQAGLDQKDFENNEDFFKWADRYGQYGMKRFKEMPCIKIFKDNLAFLEHQWEEILTRKPKYLIFREHDNGYVDIVEKNELSAQDIAIMEREHKIYLNYLKRWKAYVQSHPEKRNPVWRSPADDEYESDFALYDPLDEQGVDE